MSTNREADASMNGYFYQRYCCIYFLLLISCFKYILEEGNEDIDVVNIDDNRDLIQVKYYSSEDPESLDKSCGLLKVILANFNKEDINKIIYYAYNKSSTFFQKDLKEAFDEHLYFNIGKYVLILLYNSFVEEKIKISIRKILNISEIYDKNYSLLKEKLENNSKYNLAFKFFSDENKCNSYFSKFELTPALTYEELNLKINTLIETKYNEFINTNNSDNKNLRIELIKNTILNILTDTMFKANSTNERLISSDDINTKINEKINILTNTENLYNELLKQIGKSLNDSMITIKTCDNTIVNGYFNLIDNLKIESYDNISFYSDFIYKFIDKIDENMKNNLKYELCKLIDKNMCNISKDKYFKLLYYKSMIKSYKAKNCRKVNSSTILKILNSEHNPSIFF